jgi:hypothetical protein
LPGELIFAAPIVLLFGTATYQTFVWLAAFTATLRTWTGSPRRSVLAIGSMLILCPACLHEIVTGGDLLANAIWVAVLAALTVAAPRRLGAAGAALALGVGLSSRAHFGAVLPVVFAATARKHGVPVAAARCAGAIVAFLAVTLPFYLNHRASFSPLHTVSQLDALSGWPHAVILSSAFASVFATVWVGLSPAGERRWPEACAFAVIMPVIVASALAWHQMRMRGFDFYAWYGLSAVPFAVLSALDVRSPDGPTSSALGRYVVESNR